MFQRQQRYLDDLNRAILITALVLTIVGMFFFQYGSVVRYIISGAATILLVLLVVRMFSKDQGKRYRENMKFLTIVTAVRTWFKKTFQSKGTPYTKTQRAKPHRAHKAKKSPTWSEIRQYKYLICPQCTQRLRVPRGKGRIRVTCTRCGNVFETKS
jgi:uncharacterized paraquat-inducible protein A